MTLTGFTEQNGATPAKVPCRRQRKTEQMPTTADGRRVQDLAKGEQATFIFEDLHRWWHNLPAEPQ